MQPNRLREVALRNPLPSGLDLSEEVRPDNDHERGAGCQDSEARERMDLGGARETVTDALDAVRQGVGERQWPDVVGHAVDREERSREPEDQEDYEVYYELETVHVFHP